eukprot:CAMPEP_0117511882 /NCGR_PEP_ID=MMETSP0784-20121206/28740_1 /TAXON_ID=39447 /ORGANISM="" /LENGTH=512 /DNA_ID=CAMNT_0005307575 /DNA_START=183 /DNA_END=1721 /DNA_ORIENTATION=-
MDDARALLDSLMGQTRNEAKDKRKKGKAGDSFKHDSVCKLYLVGFCPENEKLFHNTKRDLGTCPKTHFEISKEEFNAHPEKKKYQAAYELQLLRHLTTILRRCDEWAARERQKNEEFIQKLNGYGVNSEAKRMKEMASKLLAEAEELASRGDFEGSKCKVSCAQEYEKKSLDCDDTATGLPEICDICGSIKESEKRSAFKHDAGKVHQGILMIKRMHAELKAKEAEGVLKVDDEILAEEREAKDREAKDRRAKEREAREREAREREAKEREAREREAREREERERSRREGSRSARVEDRFNGRADQQRLEDREPRDRRRRETSRGARAEDKSSAESQHDWHGSRSSLRNTGDRADRDGGRGRGDAGARSHDDHRRRRRDEHSSDRHADRHYNDGRRKRRREDGIPDRYTDRHADDCDDSRRNGNDGVDRDQREPEADRKADGNEHRYKARYIQKQFMDLLVKSRAVTPTVTYKDLEALLGEKDEWKACDEATREELATEFIKSIRRLYSSGS